MQDLAPFAAKNANKSYCTGYIIIDYILNISSSQQIA